MVSLTFKAVVRKWAFRVGLNVPGKLTPVQKVKPNIPMVDLQGVIYSVYSQLESIQWKIKVRHAVGSKINDLQSASKRCGSTRTFWVI